MADISAWSPVDESNTAAPPHGWPENMQTSGINNCGRAVMGGVRRWYDAVTSGSYVLPYLPLSGGTVSGHTQFNATIGVTGTATAGAFNSGGTSSFTTATIGNLTTGALTANGTSNIHSVTIGTCWVSGQFTAQGNANIGGTLTVDTVSAGALNSSGNSIVNGTVFAGAFSSGGNSNFTTATISNFTAGNIQLNGQINGFTSTGQITAANFYTNGNGFFNTGSSNSFTIGNLNMNGLIYWTGNQSIYTYLEGGSYDLKYRNVNDLQFICHAGGNANYVLNRLNGMAGFGGYVNTSDIRLKSDVADAGVGLAQVRRLRPVTFRRLPRGGIEFPPELGLVAQEVEAALPIAVRTIEDEDSGPTLGVMSDSITAALIGAVKELASRLEALERR